VTDAVKSKDQALTPSFAVDAAVACACRSTGKACQGFCVRTSAFPPASFRAHSARYYRVYPKTVRRTVVLCRGGPVWPPTPGQPHRVAPTAAPALSGYERLQVGVFLLPPLMHQFSVDTALLNAGTVEQVYKSPVA